MAQQSTSPAVPPVSGDPESPFRYTAQLANSIELKWQSRWEAAQTFRTPSPGESGFNAAHPKFYCLDMFPYPSGAGLHVGHPEGYTATDIISRYKRHKGFNVLHPMGWDAFGLPAEQYAIQTGVHPAITTRQAIDTFRRQLKRFGFSYDWSREFATVDPQYYRWTQWIFLRIYDTWYDRSAQRGRPIHELVAEFRSGARQPRINPDAAEFSPADKARTFGPWESLSEQAQRTIIDSHRLAYLASQTVNWCPKLGTALANEEVIDGKSERGGFPVYRKPLRQWMFRITAYAERLLSDLELVKWPESTRVQQSEWIGRSEGAEIRFPLAPGHAGGAEEIDALTVFTTRPDTIFGATFMVLAPEHPLVQQILDHPLPDTDERKLRAYVEAARHRSDVDRMAETRDKTGVFTGAYAINPAIDPDNPLWPNQHRIPIWVADYVLMGYGHGAIMAVPSHDQRDADFAQKFNIPDQNVVMPPEQWLRDHVTGALKEKSAEYLRDFYGTTNAYFHDDAYEGDGTAINSANAGVSLDGLPTAEAKQRIIEWLEKTGAGTRTVNYKLRDWLFSRQRYWGEPIPIVFDEAGNHYPVDTDRLPVILPDVTDYQPVESDEPRPLLAKAMNWVNTTAGAAGVSPQALPPNTPVKRETNTMPGWAGSCWYYLRFCDARNSQRFVSPGAERYWMLSSKVDETHASQSAGFDPHRHHAGGVDLYIGGAEHAVLHLLYARFWHKVLFDVGEVSTPEPFGRLFHQGLITSFAYQCESKTIVPMDSVAIARKKKSEPASNDDLDFFDLAGNQIPQIAAPVSSTVLARLFFDNISEELVHLESGESVWPIVAKMSKSLKNVQNPDDVIAEYGADTFRLYEMYMGPLEQSKPWNPRDIAGCFRFLQRAWRLAVDEQSGSLRLAASPRDELEKSLHRAIAAVGEQIERLSFNTAIAELIKFVNAATSAAAPAVAGDVGNGKQAMGNGTPPSDANRSLPIAWEGPLTADQLQRFAIALSPFAPHMAEELWSMVGGPQAESIAFQPWPAVDAAMLRDDVIQLPVQIMGKVRGRITVPADADQAAIERLALADEKIAALLAGRTISKVIVVPGKIVNIVAD